MNDSVTKASGKDIVILDHPSETAPSAGYSTTRSKSEARELFEVLNQIIYDFGPKPNKHALTDALITACIIGGFDTRKEIIGILVSMGCDRGHAYLRLKHGLNVFWRIHADRYTLLA